MKGVVSGKVFVAAPADVPQQVTHLFEAEGHGEYTDSDDAVHHIHDETPV